jgi:hypothetical protein
MANPSTWIVKRNPKPEPQKTFQELAAEAAKAADIASKSDDELAAIDANKGNDWHLRMACRMELQNRQGGSEPLTDEAPGYYF